MSEYLIIIEQEGKAWGAYVPDLPGLGVAGASRDEVELLAREAIDLYIEELREQGLDIPVPHHTATFARVA